MQYYQRNVFVQHVGTNFNFIFLLFPAIKYFIFNMRRYSAFIFNTIKRPEELQLQQKMKT